MGWLGFPSGIVCRSPWGWGRDTDGSPDGYHTQIQDASGRGYIDGSDAVHQRSRGFGLHREWPERVRIAYSISRLFQPAGMDLSSINQHGDNAGWRLAGTKAPGCDA